MDELKLLAVALVQGQTSANRTKAGLSFQLKKWLCAFIFSWTKFAWPKVENSVQTTFKLDIALPGQR
jgi:hypothetical protein